MSRRITSQRELSRELAERVMAHADWEAKHPEDFGCDGVLKSEVRTAFEIKRLFSSMADAAAAFGEEAARMAAGITPEVSRAVHMKERQRLKAAKRSKMNSKSSKGKKHGRKTH